MQVISAQPKAVKSLLLPLQEVRILPICDIQYGAKGCDVKRLERHVKWGVDNDCYFLGLGDYADVASPSNRRKFQQAGFYDSLREAMDSISDKHLSDLKEILAPTRKRWLGLVTGHHVWEFEDGTSTDTRLAQFLGCPYLGDGAAKVILQLEYNAPSARKTKSGRGERKLTEAHIWLHHGVGASRLPGGGLQPLYHIMSRFFAHIYLMGHRHTKEQAKIPFINHFVTRNGVIHEYHMNRVLAVCGGFLHGYQHNNTNAAGVPAADYVEKAMLPPTSEGGIMLYIRPKLHDTGLPLIDVDYSA